MARKGRGVRQRPKGFHEDPQQQLDRTSGSVNNTPRNTRCSWIWNWKTLVGVGFCLYLCPYLLSQSALFQNMLCRRLGWNPIGQLQCWVESEDVAKFVHVFDLMANTNSLEEIESLPAIIDFAARVMGNRTFLDLPQSEGGVQDNMVDKAYKVRKLYKEANESVYEFVLHGRNLMRDMLDHGFDEIQSAFRQEKYRDIEVRLGYVIDDLTDAKEVLDIVKEKVDNARSATDDLYLFIMHKWANAKRAEWSATDNTTVYYLAGACRAVALFLGISTEVRQLEPVVDAVLIMEKAEKQKYDKSVHSMVTGLQGVGGKVKNVTQTLDRCMLELIDLKTAVGKATASTEKMAGHLQREDAELFEAHLDHAKRKYKNLLVQYEETLESMKSKQLA